MSVFGPTVVAYTNTITGQDGDGNDILTPTPLPVTVMAVWPTKSTEDVNGGDTTIIGQTVLFRGLPDLSSIDEIRVNGDEYAIEGEPGFYTHPTAGVKVTEVNLTRVKGA